jgi:mono/diheme cytochrome c family protein
LQWPTTIRGLGSVLILAAAVATIGEARADAGRGAALAERWCSQCHGVRPNEASAEPKTPSFSEIAAEPSATEPSLRVFLRTPHPTMPNFILQPGDIDDLVNYILSMKPAR